MESSVVEVSVSEVVVVVVVVYVCVVAVMSVDATVALVGAVAGFPRQELLAFLPLLRVACSAAAAGSLGRSRGIRRGRGSGCRRSRARGRAWRKTMHRRNCSSRMMIGRLVVPFAMDATLSAIITGGIGHAASGGASVIRE